MNKKWRLTLKDFTDVVQDNSLSRWPRFWHWMNRIWTFISTVVDYIRSSFITKMILVSWILLAGAVIISGGASYLVAMPALEDEIEFTGKTTVTIFASTNILLFEEEGGATELQLYLDNIMEADVDDRIVEALVFDKQLKVLARKDKNKINEYGVAKKWKHLKSISKLHVINEEEKSFLTIAAPVAYSEDTDPVGYVVFIFSQTPVEHAKAKIIRQTIILLGLMILLGGAYIGWIMYRRLSPVRKVTEAFEAMNKGNFNVEVKVPKGDDEIAKLAMAAKKHQGIQRRVRKYTHPACQQIVEGKIPEEPREKSLIHVFIDIVDFTKRTRLYPIEETAKELNTFFDLFELWARRFGGIPMNYMGDGIYYVFGLMKKEAIDLVDAQQAFMCMIGVQLFFNTYAYLQKDRQNKFPIVCRIGISTGKALVARVGSSYMAMGDSVNYAARLQGKSNPGKIACENHVQLNAAWPLKEGEEKELPKKELVKDRAKWKRRYAVTERPYMMRVKGYGQKRLPIFHVKGLVDSADNERLRKHLQEFVENPETLSILKRALSPEDLEAFKVHLADQLSVERLLLQDPEPEWFIPEEKKWEGKANGDNEEE